VFGCGHATPADPNDDTCGTDGQAPVTEMVVSGRATLQSLAGLFPYQMPTDVAGVDTWLEFECAYPGAHSATLTHTALQAIIDFAPTRVELRVISVAGTVLTDGLTTTRVRVGHALVGHTDSP
jgi:hypothetical protein